MHFVGPLLSDLYVVLVKCLLFFRDCMFMCVCVLVCFSRLWSTLLRQSGTSLQVIFILRWLVNAAVTIKHGCCSWCNYLLINTVSVLLFVKCGINVPSVLWRCWLGGRKGIWPVKNWVVKYWHGYLSGARCKCLTYGPADASATPSFLAAVKSRMVYLSGAGLPRLPWKKGR